MPICPRNRLFSVFFFFNPSRFFPENAIFPFFPRFDFLIVFKILGLFMASPFSSQGGRSFFLLGNSHRFLALLFFACVVLIFIFSVFFWHSLASPVPFAEMVLERFDSGFVESGSACFSVRFVSHGEPDPLNWVVLVNSHSLRSVPFEQPVLSDCVSSAELNQPVNRIEIRAADESVFFHSSSGGALVTTDWTAELDSENATSSLATGSDLLPVIENKFVFFLFLVCFLCVLLFSILRLGPVNGILGFLVSLLAGMIVVPLFFSVIVSRFIPAAASLWVFPLPWVFFGIFLAGWVWFLIQKNSLHNWTSDDSILLAAIAVLLLILAFGQLVFPSHWWHWNGFYERQTLAVLQQGGVVTWDSLSFLGRSQTFVPGYFLAEATLSVLSQANIFFVFVFSLLVANLVFFAGCIALAKRFGFSVWKQLALALFCWLLVFSFMNSFVSPRHVLGTGLLFAVVAFFLSSEFSPVIGGIALAVMGLIQVPLLVWAGIGTAVLKAGNQSLLSDWKKLLSAGLVAGVIFLLLYAPLVSSSGFFSEASPREWGYGLSGSLDFLANQLTLPVFALLAVVLLSGLVFFNRMSNRHRVLFLALVGCLVVFLLGSFRINLLLSLFLGLLVLDWGFSFWPKVWNFCTPRRLAVVLLLVFVLAFADNWSRMPSSLYSEQDLSVYRVLSSISDENSVVLSDPLLGHSVAFFSDRRVVADLYVEFASQQQLSEAYSFLFDQNKSALSKYNVSFVLVYRYGAFRSADSFVEFPTDEKFGFLDKAYSSYKYNLYFVAPAYRMHS